MSQIDEIFIKFKNIFLGKQEEIRAFLLKYFEDTFNRHWVENIERDDTSEKIITSGFHENVSSWRDSDNNIILSTCLIINGIQKRYDYKIIIYKEKFHSEDIDKIENALKEISNLRENLHFKVALLKLDSAIKLVQEKRIPDYIKKIEEIKKEIIVAVENYNNIIDNLVKKININRKNNELDELLSNCEKILKISKSLNRDDLVMKYSLLSEQITKELIANKEDREIKLKKLEDLEIEFEIKNENEVKDDAIDICKEIIKISKSVYKDDLVEDYLKILNKLKKDKQAYEKRYRKLRSELKECDKNIKSNLEDGQIKVARANCERAIQLSEILKDDDLVKKYSFILEKMEGDISNTAKEERKVEVLEDFKAKIKKLNTEGFEALYNRDLLKAIIKYKEIRKELIDYNDKKEIDKSIIKLNP